MAVEIEYHAAFDKDEDTQQRIDSGFHESSLTHQSAHIHHGYEKQTMASLLRRKEVEADALRRL